MCDMSAKVYQYGITRMPDRLPEPVFEQAIKRHKYYNVLVALDKAFSERWNSIVAGSDAEMALATERIAALDAELVAVLEAVGKSRAAGKGKCAPELAAKVKDLRAGLKETRAQAKARKTEARAAAKPRLDELEEERKAAVKAARQAAAEDGLYWGNYNEVGDKFQTARKAMLSKRSKGQPCDLRFHRWDGSGAWTVQIQGGASWEDVTTGRCNLLQIDHVQDAAWVAASRGERRRLARTTGRIRIGSNDDRTPIWLEFPVTIHRPVPATARIKMAHVVRKKDGLRWEWRLNLVVTDADGAAPATGDTLAVHFGFRREGAVIRVATIHDGKTYETVTIPSSIMEAAERAEGLRATLDKAMDAMKARLAAWVKENAGWCPEWLREQASSLHAWKAPLRIVRLFDTWERFAGDEEIHAELDQFRRRHRHLYQWQVDLTTKISLRRREAFRAAAAAIAGRAAIVYLDDADYAAMARRPRAEDSQANEVEAAVRRMARLAAPAELRAEIERACGARNVPTARIDPANITRACTVCGNVAESGELGVGVQIRCPACHTEHDRDKNAVRNVWLRGEKDRSQNAA